MNEWLTGEWVSLGRITLAALLGAIVGYERERSGHPAGVRTNMLVCVGSCLFTLLSIDGFPIRGNAQDTARIAAQVVVGVGFLGAGVVVQTRKRPTGLTTAATIWLVAAVGMAVGTGAYLLSLYTTLLVAAILLLRARVSPRDEARSASLRRRAVQRRASAREVSPPPEHPAPRPTEE